MYQDDALYWLIMSVENIKSLYQKTIFTQEEKKKLEDSFYFVEENYLEHFYSNFESDLSEAKKASLDLVKLHTNQTLIIFGIVMFLLMVICIILLFVYRSIYTRLCCSSAIFGLLSEQEIKSLIDKAYAYLSSCYEEKQSIDQICHEDYEDCYFIDLESWEAEIILTNKNEERQHLRESAVGPTRIIKMTSKGSLEKKSSLYKLKQFDSHKKVAIAGEKYMQKKIDNPFLTHENLGWQKSSGTKETAKSENKSTKLARLDSIHNPKTQSEAITEPQEEKARRIYAGTKNHYPSYFKRVALSLLISMPLQLGIVLMDYAISSDYSNLVQFHSLNWELRSSSHYLNSIFLEYLSGGTAFHYPSHEQKSIDAMDYFLLKQQIAISALNLFESNSLPAELDRFADGYKSLAHENVCKSEVVSPVLSSIAESSHF